MVRYSIHTIESFVLAGDEFEGCCIIYKNAEGDKMVGQRKKMRANFFLYKQGEENLRSEGCRDISSMRGWV